MSRPLPPPPSAPTVYTCYLIVVGDDDVIAGGRSIEDDLLVGLRSGSPVNPEHLVMLRHAERLHGLAVLGLDALDFQSGPARESSKVSLLCRIFLFFVHRAFQFIIRRKLTNEREFGSERGSTTNNDKSSESSRRISHNADSPPGGTLPPVSRHSFSKYIDVQNRRGGRGRDISFLKDTSFSSSLRPSVRPSACLYVWPFSSDEET